MFTIKKIKNHMLIFYTFAAIKKGALAHLARAFDWQSKGDEFDSRMLHFLTKDSIFFVLTL